MPPNVRWKVRDKFPNTYKSDEMVLTVHRWFANKSCPGDWLYNRLGDLAARVTEALGGTAQTPTADKTVWYRVRKTWADVKSQIGAYKNLANAKACVDKHPGYSVFDVNGVNIYTSKTTTSAVPFKVRVAISDLNIRKGPGTNHARTKYIPVGVYTIVEVQSGTGSDKGWGRLKSGAGWISLDFCTKV